MEHQNSRRERNDGLASRLMLLIFVAITVQNTLTPYNFSPVFPREATLMEMEQVLRRPSERPRGAQGRVECRASFPSQEL